MASSELILAPVVDRNALKKTQMQTENAMKEAGKKASIDTRKHLHKNIRQGTIKGFDDGIRTVSPKLKMIGAAVAVAAGAVIADTLDKTLGTLDENIDRIMGKMESIREIALNAAAFGITSERYAAMSVMATSAGMDQGDLQGIMAGYVAALKDPEMAKFQKMAKTKGMEASFFNFLASTGTLSEQERQQRLIGVFGEDDMRLVSRFLQPMMQMQKSGQQLSLQNLFQTMTGTQLDLPSLRRGMGRTAAAQQAVTAQQTTQLLAQLTTGVTPGQAAAVTAVAESKARVDAARMTTLDLQVKTRIIADNLEIKQIEAGKMMVTETFDYGSDVSRFVQDPSLQTYLPTIPMWRWWQGNMQGSGNPADGAMGVVSSGAGKSLLNMPMDFFSQSIIQMNDYLSSIASDTKEAKNNSSVGTFNRSNNSGY